LHDLDIVTSTIKDLRKAALVAADHPMRPIPQHRRHQVWFLCKIALAILAAGGTEPTYDKNRVGGSWPSVIDGLRASMPADFLNVSPATLARWTKRVRLVLENR
jgi:hypothetical protein